jgi:hypothetical protein
MDDEAFLDHAADALAALPGVRAVALGGSRGAGTAAADSDWDLGIYYVGGFQPQHLRDLGWPGEVFELGAWGGGVFNGGAWLSVDGRRVDVHYRDLTSVEHELAEARAGRFRIEPLMFYLAGIPSYLVVAELAVNRVLRGCLPHPAFPEQLRRNAGDVWSTRAEWHLTYAEHTHAAQGRLATCTGLLVLAALQFAHAILAAKGQWVVNEKTLLQRAGLDEVDDLVAGLTAEPAALRRAVEAVRALGRDRLVDGTRPPEVTLPSRW